MRILVTGGEGQLAHDVVRVFAGEDVTALGRGRLDVTVLEHVEGAINALRPDIVVNTAAFHDVDRCDTEPEPAFAVNAAAPQRLAAACKAIGAHLIHISTDYVFDGAQTRPYAENDRVNPLSVYGASKAAGEMAIRATSERHLIIRTTGLYGLRGRRTGRGNFVETMLRLAGDRRPVSVVDDQILTPTSTADLAVTMERLIRLGATGTVHVTNSGSCSWYAFARAIFRLANVKAELTPTTQSEFPRPARRPAYSVLGHGGIMALGIGELPDWEESLAVYVRARTDPSTG